MRVTPLQKSCVPPGFGDVYNQRTKIHFGQRNQYCCQPYSAQTLKGCIAKVGMQTKSKWRYNQIQGEILPASYASSDIPAEYAGVVWKNGRLVLTKLDVSNMTNLVANEWSVFASEF